MLCIIIYNRDICNCCNQRKKIFIFISEEEKQQKEKAIYVNLELKPSAFT